MLDVPLDYNNLQGARASVPLIKLSAFSNQTYAGMILTNPGGPGDSGIDSVLSYGSLMQSVVGGSYDIVAFDPRGLGYSIPGANCSSTPDATSPFRRRSEYLEGPDNAQSSWDSAFSGAVSLGKECKAAIGGPDQAGSHMSTSTNVRDMISIVDAFALTSDGQKAPNASQVNFWGFSYGTFIGQTLASIFPSRIGRVVLDGVMDPDDYVSGLGLKSLQFTDEAFATFFTSCHIAGPEKCSYYTGNSAADILNRFERTFNALDAPRAEAQNATNATIVETALEFVKQIGFLSTYYPISLYPILSDALVSFETALVNLTADALEQIVGQIQEALPTTKNTPILIAPYTEWYPAVACTDTNGSSYGLMYEDLEPYIRTLENQSTIGGDSWASNRVLCTGWEIKSDDRFAGPFGGDTKNPILFVSNTLDPATPIYNGRKSASLFPSSRLLTIEGVGHTTISSLNLCAFKNIGQYFKTGLLPRENEVCAAEPGAFNVTLQGLLGNGTVNATTTGAGGGNGTPTVTTIPVATGGAEFVGRSWELLTTGVMVAILVSV
ncbi:hypothetical protein B7463_g3343, partial [Scytalidium lignicola]